MSGPVANTRTGQVEGVDRPGHQRYLGIPYAAPPVGRRRFRPPETPEAWTEVRDATRFGPVVPQVPSPLDQVLGSAALVTDEAQCLTVNVWTPATDAGRRPVMVWIHGGAFVTGSGSVPWYDGGSFAVDHDIVVVTLNYRLGVLGFSYLDDRDAALAGSGSVGIQDQAAALRWVRDNIAGFGGDPGNVTIFGESAGAMSVGTLLALPEARGLFHKAILQSGAASHTLSPEQAGQVTGELLSAVGRPGAGVADLQELPIEALMDAQAKVAMAYARRGLSYQPVVDGQVLPGSPLAAVATGAAAGIPLLIGTNADEWNLFSALDPRFSATDPAALLRAAARLFHTEEAGRAAVDTYGRCRPSALPPELLSALTTDNVFRLPAIRLAEAQHKAGGRAWMYLFTWPTPALGGRLRSCHALEIPFVFGNLAQPGASVFVGDSPPEELARTMNSAWAAFARGGEPGGGALGAWPAYEPGSRSTMVFDLRPTLEEDPMGEERALWDDVV